jgi:hypothetical protein
MGLNALIKGWTGELKTKIADTLFLDLNEYHIFNNVLIDTGSWTTQIDHVIVSRYGVFVVETKNKDGWIFGEANDRYWTQVFPNKKKFKFQNPLKQNIAHTLDLAKRLNISSTKMHSVIIFWGNCRFKKVMPENVLNNNRADYIKSKTQILLNEGEIEKICQQLQNIKDNTSSQDNQRHVEMLKKRSIAGN